MDVTALTRRALSLALATILMLWIYAGTAQANSISIAAPSDPTMDKTFQMMVSGEKTDDDYSFVSLFVKRAGGGSSCGANPSAESSSHEYLYSEPEKGPYQRSTNVTLDQTGSYLACAYLSKSSTSVEDSDQRTFSVRAPRVTLALAAPSQVRPDTAFEVILSGGSEVERRLFVTYKPAGGGSSCARTYQLDRNQATGASGFFERIQGSYRRVDSFSQGLDEGVWLYCAYVHRHSDDELVDARAQAEIRVGNPPPSGEHATACALARTQLSSLVDRYRLANRVMSRAVRSYNAAVRFYRSSSSALAKRSARNYARNAASRYFMARRVARDAASRYFPLRRGIRIWC